ncbi:hypothetical protein ACIBCM_30770 [Streptomyces sp. NPDC051018]|uniref:hypothetical protein n=1 Tax=Streptomyces sp. NPDC051018 TaxID=3365639 RepID=UPI003796F7A8
MTGRRNAGERGGGAARAAAETIAGWAVLVLVPGLLAFQAWIVMLVVGAVHSAAASVPAFGYGASVLVALGLDLAAFLVIRFLRFFRR